MKLWIFLLLIIIVLQSKLKQQITGQTGNGETKTFEIIVPLENLSNFWSTIEMPWINCEFSLQLLILQQNPSFQINDTKHCIPSVTLSTQQSEKRFKQLESGFERTINWNRCLASQVQNK